MRRYFESQPEGTKYLTTTINLKEIAVGRELVDEFDPAEIRSQFEWVRVLPITPEIPWEIAKIEAELYRAEEPNRDRINALAGDALIAGAVADLGATVVTTNLEEFRALGVPTETYE